jgi:hypothetical protein
MASGPAAWRPGHHSRATGRARKREEPGRDGRDGKTPACRRTAPTRVRVACVGCAPCRAAAKPEPPVVPQGSRPVETDSGGKARHARAMSSADGFGWKLIRSCRPDSSRISRVPSEINTRGMGRGPVPSCRAARCNGPLCVWVQPAHLRLPRIVDRDSSAGFPCAARDARGPDVGRGLPGPCLCTPRCAAVPRSRAAVTLSARTSRPLPRDAAEPPSDDDGRPAAGPGDDVRLALKASPWRPAPRPSARRAGWPPRYRCRPCRPLGRTPCRAVSAHSPPPEKAQGRGSGHAPPGRYRRPHCRAGAAGWPDATTVREGRPCVTARARSGRQADNSRGSILTNRPPALCRWGFGFGAVKGPDEKGTQCGLTGPNLRLPPQL